MRKDVLSKYTGQPHDAGATEGHYEPIGEENGVAAAFTPPRPTTTGGLITLDGATAVMLDCRFRDGKRLALPYSYLSRVDLDPSGAIACSYPMVNITLLGRSLMPIYAAIANHTAIAIVESEAAFDAGGDAPFIERIEVEDPGQADAA